jgi:hypothetical protein
MMISGNDTFEVALWMEVVGEIQALTGISPVFRASTAASRGLMGRRW